MKYRDLHNIPNFSNRKSAGIWKIVRQIVYAMFIRNYRALFDLWLKENLPKHQKPQTFMKITLCKISFAFYVFINSSNCHKKSY